MANTTIAAPAKKALMTRKGATTSTPAAKKIHASIELAQSIGVGCAREWLNRDDNKPLPTASLEAWRARCYADEVHEHEDHPNFLPLLAAWETGFDDTLRAAGVIMTDTAIVAPAQPDISLFQLSSYGWREVDINADRAVRLLENAFQSAVGVGGIAMTLRQGMVAADIGDGPLSGYQISALITAIEQLSNAVSNDICGYANYLEDNIKALKGGAA